jgi:hypothetical protein
MEDLGYRMLTAQTGPEALSIERAGEPIHRSGDAARYQGAKLGLGNLARMSSAAVGRPAERAAKLRAVLAGECQTERGSCLSQEKPSATSRRS